MSGVFCGTCGFILARFCPYMLSHVKLNIKWWITYHISLLTKYGIRNLISHTIFNQLEDVKLHLFNEIIYNEVSTTFFVMKNKTSKLPSKMPKNLDQLFHKPIFLF